MRILFTKSEGSVWNPLYLRNIDRQVLLDLLTKSAEDVAVKRNRNYTILKGINVSSTILPDLPYEENLKFHSLMVEDGTIFDSYIYHIDKNGGLDCKFFEARNFGLSAKRFDDIWKDRTIKMHEVLVSKKIKAKRLYKMKWERKRQRKKKKK